MMHRFLARAVHSNLHKLQEVLQRRPTDVSTGALRVLDTVDIPPAASSHVLFKLSSAAITIFFRLLWGRVQKGDDCRELYFAVMFVVVVCFVIMLVIVDARRSS
jgi:hypothetical protein